MRDKIVQAAKSTLVREGLAGWTVDAVAKEARCAKGLVHYHHRSKSALLAAVTTLVRSERMARRLAALEQPGAKALDALWLVLAREVATGECSAWFALVTVPDPPVRAALRLSAQELDDLAAVVEGSLDLRGSSPDAVRLLLTALDGLQLPLLLGDTEESVREAYDRFWLAALS